MSIFLWVTRRVGGLSILALIALVYISLSLEWSARKQNAPGPRDKLQAVSHAPKQATVAGNGGRWTITFAYYSLLIHFLVLMFPVRACYAVGSLTRGVKAVARNKSLQRLSTASREGFPSSPSRAMRRSPPRSQPRPARQETAT